MSNPIDTSQDVEVIGIGFTYQFSKGRLAHILKSRGLDLGVGYNIAHQVHENLIEQGIKEIKDSDLRKVVRDVALEVTGKQINEIYNLVEKWHDSSIPLIILISGARGMGKSELGGSLSSRFGFPKLVSTATIAQIMKTMITAELSPELHAKSFEAYKCLRPMYSILYDPVLIGYEEHAKYPAGGVEAIVKRAINENQNMIIRGEHLLPRFLSEKLISHPSVIYITLQIPEEEIHRARFLGNYPREELKVRSGHFEAIRKIHNYLVEQAKSRDHLIVDITSISDAVPKIEEIVLSRLKRMFPRNGKKGYQFKSFDSAVINS